MKLRYLRGVQLVLGVLIVAMPALKTVSMTDVRPSVWYYVFWAVCIGLFSLFHKMNRCPHCKKQLGYEKLDKCPHCAEPLDV